MAPARGDIVVERCDLVGRCDGPGDRDQLTCDGIRRGVWHCLPRAIFLAIERRGLQRPPESNISIMKNKVLHSGTSPEAPEGSAVPPPPAGSAVVQRVVVGPEDAGQRLDKVLVRLMPDVPRSHLFRLLRKGEVRVNGGRVRGETRLAEGDLLRLPPVRAPETPAAERVMAVPRGLVDTLERAILREDPNLLVIDKPAGVAVHGGSGIGFGVIEALRASRPDEELELVHRLDRDTSGCLLVARRRSTLRNLHALMREDAFDKRYLALLRGKWEFGRKVIDARLNTEARVGGERVVRVDPAGKSAQSEFKVVQFFGRLATLVEVRLLTGRTHQIRVHAAHAGHPVAGDPKYGDDAYNQQLRDFGLDRLFLHAHSVGYEDPEGRGAVSISAPLPPDLARFLDRLAAVAASGKLRPVIAEDAPPAPRHTPWVKPDLSHRPKKKVAARSGIPVPRPRPAAGGAWRSKAAPSRVKAGSAPARAATPRAKGPAVRAAKTPRRGAPRRAR